MLLLMLSAAAVVVGYKVNFCHNPWCVLKSIDVVVARQ